MIIKKYNRFNDKTPAQGSSSSFSSGVSSSSEGYPINRKLWGNKDRGGDIDATIHTVGSVYAHPLNYQYNDDDDDDATDFSQEPDDNGGNVYADNVVAKSRVYLPYPNASGPRADLAPLIKGHEDRISTLEKSGGASTPGLLPLVSGTLNYNSSTRSWSFRGFTHPSIGSVVVAEVSHAVLQLVVYPAEGYPVPTGLYRSSIMVMQARTTKTTGAGTGNIDDYEGGPGAHWFEAYFLSSSSTAAYLNIREFHLSPNTAGAWCSNDWSDITSVNVSIIGWPQQPS